MSKITQILIIAILIFLGVSAIAAGSLPFSFKAGDPISADEVNSNFAYLNDGKQNLITGSPCGDGQFIQGIGADGMVTCSIDQIGTAGSSGVSSLNGKTGSLAIEGGNGVIVSTAEDGTLKINIDNGSEFSTQATIGIPSSGVGNVATTAFKITNNNTTVPSIAINGISIGGYGVAGKSTTGSGVIGSTTGGTGSYGVQGINGGRVGITAGVYGGSNSPQGYGVFGINNFGGIGVKGSTPKATGVEGAVTESTAGSTSKGVYGFNAGAGIGVKGESPKSTGVQGIVTSSTAGNASVGVSGINYGNTGFGVRGEHKGLGYGVYGTAPQVGVGGQSANIGVLGIGSPAMKAQGNTVQTLGSFGWAKAMIYYKSDGPGIIRCFNSQATNPALVQGNGCGFTVSGFGNFGGYATDGTINFGFDVTKTFPMLTLGHFCDGDESSQNCAAHVQIEAPNTIRVFTSDLDDDWTNGQEFFLILF